MSEGRDGVSGGSANFVSEYSSVASLFNSRNMNATANRSNWSTIISYLKSTRLLPGLGLKQDRFTILLPSGMPDFSIDIVEWSAGKACKVNRPKALCFDYLQLKEMFGLKRRFKRGSR